MTKKVIMYSNDDLRDDISELKELVKSNSEETKHNTQAISVLTTSISVLKQCTEDHLKEHDKIDRINNNNSDKARSWGQYLPSILLSLLALIIATIDHFKK